MTWRGSWPGVWPGDWQGGQEASPFANMAAVLRGAASVTATAETSGGGTQFADMAATIVASATVNASLAAGSEQEGPLHSISFGYASPSLRAPQGPAPAYLDMAATISAGAKVRARAEVRQGFDVESMLAKMRERTNTEQRRLRQKRDEEAMLALL